VGAVSAVPADRRSRADPHRGVMGTDGAANLPQIAANGLP